MSHSMLGVLYVAVLWRLRGESMKLIIEISEGIYKHIDTIQNGSIGAKQILNAVKDGIPAYKAIPTAEPKIVPIAEIHFDEDKMREVCKEVAENIVVEYDFKGKTNGEVIKILFPNIDNYFSNVIDLRLWWNSPYEPQERSE